MKTKRLLSVILLLMAALLPLHAQCAGTLYQVSTLQALMQGDYYGAVSVCDLLSRGDTGLGTFDGLDGEMIVLGGVAYRASYDGSILQAGAEELSPFANVAFIGNGESREGSFKGGYGGLLAALTALAPDGNMPVVFCVAGCFSGVTVRSVPRQSEPYPPLTDVVKKQAVFSREQVRGTVVGFRFPAYMGDLNATGYHLHFLSDDRAFGGHLLEAASGEIGVRFRELNELTMELPRSIALYNLTQTTDAEIETVEGR